MSKTKRSLILTGLFPVVFALAGSACATKKYVQAQIAPVNTKLGELATKTDNEADKEQNDVSRVEEKLGSTDRKVAEVEATAQQANTTATQANQLAQQDQAGIAANQSAIAAANSSIATLDKAMTYTLVASGEVTFAFNKSALGKVDKEALNALVQQVQSKARVQFELLGFTDKVGGPAYNIALSNRRADAVARYLIEQGMQLRGVHIIGLGKEQVPAELVADVPPANSNKMARRVVIKVYAADADVQAASLK